MGILSKDVASGGETAGRFFGGAITTCSPPERGGRGGRDGVGLPCYRLAQ